VVAADVVQRGEVFLVDLNPTRGGEIRKTRPRVVVSPDELNAYLRTFIVAPLTMGGHPYPFRVPCRFGGRSGHAAGAGTLGSGLAMQHSCWGAQIVGASARGGQAPRQTPSHLPGLTLISRS
jgi:hypothetical protein